MTTRCHRALHALACVLATTLLPITAACAGDDAAALKALLRIERARPAAPRLERDAFMARPAIVDAHLSPDGRRFAWLQAQDGRRALWLQSVDAGAKPQKLVTDIAADTLSWSQDGRWLFVATARQLFAVAAAGQGGSRAIAVLDDKTRRSLLTVDPTRPSAVVLLEHPRPGSGPQARWRLLRVDAGGTQQRLHEAPQQIVDVAFDRDDLAAFVGVDGDAHVVMRRDGAGDWQRTLRCADLARCVLLGIDDDGDLWLHTDVDADRQRLAVLGHDGRLTTRHEDPRGEADLDRVVLDPQGGAPLIALYRSTVGAQYALTTETESHLAVIERQLPDRLLDIEIGRGADARWLLRERDDTVHGAHYHLFDPATGRRQPILADQPFEGADATAARLPPAALARRIPFAWSASDGMRLHGFLSVPPGIDLGDAPLVVSVHGGPFSRARPGFSSEAQLLANRGYIVFEPNYRGSTGHGRGYMRAANGDFGNGRVQQDIIDGTRWLHAQGIGDPRRTAIIGASFGGYAALLGMTFEPELFRVALAGVPATDFGWTIRDYARSDAEMQAGIPIATSMRQLDLDPDDEALIARLRAQSPTANVARVRGPVLLFAAGQDERVAIRSVTHYAAALAALGKDVSLFVDDDAGHTIADRTTGAAWFFVLEAMLHRHLGGAAPTPPDDALREHLRRGLRRSGKDMREFGDGQAAEFSAAGLR